MKEKSFYWPLNQHWRLQILLLLKSEQNWWIQCETLSILELRFTTSCSQAPLIVWFQQSGNLTSSDSRLNENTFPSDIPDSTCLTYFDGFLISKTHTDTLIEEILVTFDTTWFLFVFLNTLFAGQLALNLTESFLKAKLNVEQKSYFYSLSKARSRVIRTP